MKDSTKFLEDVEIKMYIPISNASSLSWDLHKGQKLKKLREIRGKMPQATLIERLADLGVVRTRNSITYLEKANQNTVDKEVILGICQILGVSLKYFYEGVILAGIEFKEACKDKIEEKV